MQKRGSVGLSLVALVTALVSVLFNVFTVRQSTQNNEVMREVARAIERRAAIDEKFLPVLEKLLRKR